MKLVFVNSCPYWGGAEAWQLRTALALQSRGHKVSMLLRPGPLADRARAYGLELKLIPLAFDLDLYSLLQGFRFFRKKRPDMILLNDQRECRLIAPAAALAGVRLRIQRKGWPYLKGSWRDRLVYRFFVTHLLAASKQIALIFAEKSGLPAERIRVLPGGVDLSRFQGGDRIGFRAQHGLRPDELILGSAGRLVSQKGYDLLLRALTRISLPSPAKVIIAGEGPERKKLEVLAQESALASQVIFLGEVEDIPSFLAALDIFVFPSRQEGLSNAVIEAMAAGLPIIATAIPGNDDLIRHKDTGLLVVPEDPTALAEAIQFLAGNPELARGLACRARAYTEEHLDGERILADLEAYLESLTRC